MAQTEITIDATEGGSSANSLLDLASVDTLIHQKPFHADWDLISSDDEKHAAMLWATRLLCGLKWDGSISSLSQKLAFPRNNIYDFEGRTLDGIPDFIQAAFSELVFILATQNILSDSETKGLKGLKMGSMSLTIDTDFVKETMPEYIMEMIAPWLSTEYMNTSVKIGRV